MRKLVWFVVPLLGLMVGAAVAVVSLWDSGTNRAILLSSVFGPEFLLVLLLTPVIGKVGRDGVRAWRMRDPVRGEATVVSASAPSDEARHARCELVLVVRAADVPATTVQHTCIAETKRWPVCGATLPVTLDRADPTRLRIEWGEVPTVRQSGVGAAERFAAAARAASQPGHSGVDPAAAGTSPQVFQAQSISVDGRTIDAREHPALREDILRLVRDGLGDPERLQSDLGATLQRHGIRLDGGSGGGGGSGDLFAGRAGDSDGRFAGRAGDLDGLTERLRRLDTLRQQGLINDQEYQEQRSRILSEL